MNIDKSISLALAVFASPAFSCDKSLLEIAKRIDDPYKYSQVKNTSRCEGIYGGFRSAEAGSILSLIKFHNNPFEAKIRNTGELMLTWDQKYTKNIRLTGNYLRSNFFYKMDDYEVNNSDYIWPLSDLHAILEFPINIPIDVTKLGIVLSVETTSGSSDSEYVAVSSSMSPESSVYDIGLVANEDLKEIEWRVINSSGTVLYMSSVIENIYKNGFININVEKNKVDDLDFFKLRFYGTLPNGTKPIQEFTLSGPQSK